MAGAQVRRTRIEDRSLLIATVLVAAVAITVIVVAMRCGL